MFVLIYELQYFVDIIIIHPASLSNIPKYSMVLLISSASVSCSSSFNLSLFSLISLAFDSLIILLIRYSLVLFSPTLTTLTFSYRIHTLLGYYCPPVVYHIILD